MKRNNPYELAFATWARRWGAVVLPLAEIHRQQLQHERVKTPDFLVLGHGGPEGARLVVDVKGRRLGGTPDRPCSTWPNWCHLQDVEALPRWADHLGPCFQPVLAFVYAVAEHVVLPLGTVDLIRWQGQLYLIRGVDVHAYRQHMRQRSRRWQTVFLPRSDFRRLVRPFSWFLDPAAGELSSPREQEPELSSPREQEPELSSPREADPPAKSSVFRPGLDLGGNIEANPTDQDEPTPIGLKNLPRNENRSRADHSPGTRR